MNFLFSLILISFSVYSEDNLFIKNIYLNKLKVLKEQERKFVDRLNLQKTYSIENIILEVDIRKPINQLEFLKIENNYSIQVQRNYAGGATPYPGELTTLEKCDPNNLPKLITYKGKKLIEAYLNKDLSYGACIKKDVFKKACIWFHFDSLKKEAIRFKLIVMPNQSCEKNIEKYFKI